MLDFAVKVANDSRSVDDHDFSRLESAGFDRDDIWDIAAIAGLFGMSNRIANVISMRPNDEFYAMGR